MSAQLVAVVGPSGAGKDTLMEAACAVRPDIRAARRVITRPASAGGEDFDGVTPGDFARMEAEGAFALQWEAHGLRYAIPKSALEGEGLVLFNASRAVLAQAAERWPDLVVLLVTAPPEVLAARLAGRGREDSADQARRIARAGFALPEGLNLRRICNDGAQDLGVQRFLDALPPVRG